MSAVTTIVDSLTDFLLGNAQRDSKFHGLNIWTDQSNSEGAFRLDGRKEIINVQVAPQNISFVQRSRISEQVIKDGKAFFFWRKDRDSGHLDLLEVQISGITRSLMRERKQQGLIERLASEIPIPLPVGSAGNEEGPSRKQQEWLRFWRLTREPFIIGDRINHHIIQLETPALPVPVKFIGHFSAPIQWTEVADNPFLVQWQLGLVVHRTEPDIEALISNALTVNVVTP